MGLDVFLDYGDRDLDYLGKQLAHLLPIHEEFLHNRSLHRHSWNMAKRPGLNHSSSWGSGTSGSPEPPSPGIAPRNCVVGFGWPGKLWLYFRQVLTPDLQDRAINSAPSGCPPIRTLLNSSGQSHCNFLF